jgi:spore germination protein KA
MFNVLRKKLKKALGKNKNMKVSHEQFDQGESQTEKHIIASSLRKNKKTIQAIFNNCADVKFREFELGTVPPVKLMIVYIDGLVSTADIHISTLDKLMLLNGLMEEVSANNTLHLIKNKLLPIGQITEDNDFVSITGKILAGDTALFIEGEKKALVLGARGWESRAIAEAESEPVVRGPRDGFTEKMLTNIILIRRRIKTSRLKIETIKIGVLTKTDIGILYIDGIANDKVVEEVRFRLKRIDTDAILESGYIEEFIQDEWLSPFPQVLSTERPDRAAAHLVEGHVVIVVDTTPFVLIVPVTFFHFLTAAEDYYSRNFITMAVRLLRLVAINIALLLPSVYIAVITFHQEMIPTALMINVAGAREGIPFPAFVEAFIMETTFELLREAGVRLPRPVGQAISIVGALVIGQSAVAAGLVSPAMVIIVALTAIASFAIPNYSGAIALRLLRFPLMILAAMLGLFGIMVGLLALLIHLCALRSFGVPYIAPIAPFVMSDLKDFIFRFPVWAMFTRPRLIGYKEPQRQEYMKEPKPPEDKEKQ